MYFTFKLKRPVLGLAAVGIALLAVLALLSLFIFKKEPLPSSSTSQLHTLVIDPGHGGMDGGAVAFNGVKESDINLATALKLRALAVFYGADSIMTRQDDVSLCSSDSYSERKDLENRAAIVSSAPAPVLISIHQNFFPTSQPSGPQVLYSENGHSDSLGHITHNNLLSALAPGSRRVAGPASKDLYVLNSVSCPAILVECGFMSNPAELEKLMDTNYQKKMASILMASYLQYSSGLDAA